MPDFDLLNHHASRLAQLTDRHAREDGLASWGMFVGTHWRAIADMWKVREEEKEICICAAVRTPDGLIFRGHRHSHAMTVTWNEYPTLHITQDMQGFVTSRNHFVSRAEGAELQRLAGVKSAATGREVEGDALFSEDLY